MNLAVEYLKGYGFLSFTKNIGKNIGKNASKNVSGKYSLGFKAACQKKLPIYNLMDYSNNYSSASGNLWQYYRDKQDKFYQISNIKY